MALNSTTTTNILSEHHKCIGTYEDKPTNCIYYFTSYAGPKGNYDSILEYNLIEDVIRVVYQDGRMDSSGSFSRLLRFDRGKPITGVNKIDDILYWTDDRNRPRKINVRLAKKNEKNITDATRYIEFYYKSNTSVVFITPSDNHGFKIGDHIYTHNNSADLTPYNGYAEVTGIVKTIDQNTSYNTIANDSTIISSSSISERVDPGDFIGIIYNNFPYFFQVESVSGTSITIQGEPPSFTASNLKPLYLLGSGDNTPMAGVITNCPWAFSADMTGQFGIMMHANPEDAYSPLITFGSELDKKKYLDVVKHQPTYRPKTQLESDGTAKNDILDNIFQFKYRYKHYDNEISSYSGMSDIQIDEEFALNRPLTYENYQDTKNIVDVEYFDTISDVKNIELVARRGNTGEFVLIDTVENNFISYLKILKNQLIPDPDYYLDVDKSSIKFKNNGTYPFVDKKDSDKLFDAVPKLAKAQTVLSNNRLAYGNVLEGYDNVPVVTNSSFVTEGNPVVTQGKIPLLGYGKYNLSIGPLDTSYQFHYNDGGFLHDAFEGSNTYSYWNSGPSQRCEVSTYIDLSSIAGGLAEGQTQTISIDLGWKVVRKPSDISGGKTRRAGGRFLMNVDLTGVTTISGVKDKISSQFESPNLAGWNGGTVAGSSSAFSDVVKEDGYWDIEYQGNVMKIKGKTVTNEEMSGNLPNNFGWASGDNDGWGGGNGRGYVWYVNAYFTSGTPGFNSFKTGAFHDFGISYFDETNRCSFVNVAPKYENFSGSRAYNPFITEDGGAELGQTSTVKLEIYNKPPSWATHYQIMYTGNTTVDDFMHVASPLSKPGENGDTQVYIGMQSLKGHKSSYNEATGADVDYEFLEKGGDRIRFISCVHNGQRKKFDTYLDFKITGFDFYQDEGEELPITLSDGQEGFFIRIANPGDTNVYLEDGSEVSIGHSGFDYATSGYNKLIAEVYREKKSTSEESMIYYEIGDKIEIVKPGSINRAHAGNIQNQDSNYDFDSTIGISVSDVPAIISIETGDVYLKPREMFTAITTGGDLESLENFSCEDYYLNDFHSTNHWSRGRINVINNNSKERRLSATVYYSETYSSTGSINGLSTFNLAEIPYFDYNVNYGSIQSLKMRDNDLIIFHENKVGRVLVEKDILNTASAEGLVSLSKNIIANYVMTFAGEFGCGLNPESIVQYDQKFYFVDVKKGVALRLGGDGLTIISDYGMKDYFRDLGEMYIKYNPNFIGISPTENTYLLEQMSNPYLIVGGYDPKYDEYVVTFPEVKLLRDNGSSEYVDASSWDGGLLNWENVTDLYNVQDPLVLFHPVTIGFSEGQNRWTSFYSFIPDFYSKINKQFVTFKSGRLYRHNNSDIYSRNTLGKADMNTFYGERHLSYLDFVFNAEPSSVKTYNAIALESDTKFLTGLFSNMGQTYGNYNDVISTSIAFRKVDGSVTALNNDDYTNVLKGNGTQFYKDLKKGDLVRVFGYFKDKERSSSSYKDFIVSSIDGNTQITLNESLNYEDESNELLFSVEESLIYVIDYKTKEGIQYADIPFCASSPVQGNQVSFGDGSEIIYVGKAGHIFKMFDVGKSPMSVSKEFKDLYPLSIKMKIWEAQLGGEYAVTGDGLFDPVLGDIDLSSFTNVNSIAEKNIVFKCVSENPVPTNFQAEIVPTHFKLYAKTKNNETYFLGYPYSLETPYLGEGLHWLIPPNSYMNSFSNSFGYSIENLNHAHLYIVKDGTVEGEKMKGSYLRTILATNKNQSTSKFNLYAANVDVDKSELSNK